MIFQAREFGAVNIKPKELRLGMDLGDAPFEGNIEKAKLTGPMPRISHMTIITDESQLGPDLIRALKASHARCH